MSEEQRPLLSPVIGPLAAMIIDRELGEWLEKRATELRRVNQPRSARQLSDAAAQLREAARQYVERSSASGSGEVPERGDAAGLEMPPGTASYSSWWSTAVVAGELGIGSRQVRNLAQDGPLTATTVGGRLLFDPVSVLEEKQRRERQRGRSHDDPGEDSARAGGVAVQGRRAR